VNISGTCAGFPAAAAAAARVVTALDGDLHT